MMSETLRGFNNTVFETKINTFGHFILCVFVRYTFWTNVLPKTLIFSEVLESL